jgi:FixJ family two-component response regulator
MEDSKLKVLIREYSCVSSREKIMFCTMPIQDHLRFVAIVDDDESVRTALQGLIEEAGFAAFACSSAEEFLESGKRRQTACLIADIRMPGLSGLDLQSRLNADRQRIPIIFITAHGDEEMRLKALRAGAVEFLAKPFDDEILLESVQAALTR